MYELKVRMVSSKVQRFAEKGSPDSPLAEVPGCGQKSAAIFSQNQLYTVKDLQGCFRGCKDLEDAIAKLWELGSVRRDRAKQMITNCELIVQIHIENDEILNHSNKKTGNTKKEHFLEKKFSDLTIANIPGVGATYADRLKKHGISVHVLFELCIMKPEIFATYMKDKIGMRYDCALRAQSSIDAYRCLLVVVVILALIVISDYNHMSGTSAVLPLLLETDKISMAMRKVEMY